MASIISSVTLVLLIGFSVGVVARNRHPYSSSSSAAVNLTIVERAADTGAFCLDGSLPAYCLDKGFGSGENNWLLYLEGGGWCDDINSCTQRMSTHLGSSKYMGNITSFLGILSNKQQDNPDFYNWNRVKLMYCDGASFSGDVEDAKQVHLAQLAMDYAFFELDASKLYFRGQRIWHAIVNDLLNNGMDKAEKALLSGTSAGGLATFLHCDNFRELLPSTAMVKCASDAGFFLDVKDISGDYNIRSVFKNVVILQDVVKNLPQACTSALTEPTQCFFPQYLLPYINTPMFILNPAYDTWQINNIFVPSTADPSGQWNLCKSNPYNCTTNQLQILGGYRLDMLSILETFKQSETGGLFINSCFIHGQMDLQETWFSDHSPMLNNKTIAQAVGDWYFGRSFVQYVDCPFPCDKTCYGM